MEIRVEGVALNIFELCQLFSFFPKMTTTNGPCFPRRVFDTVLNYLTVLLERVATKQFDELEPHEYSQNLSFDKL